MKKLIKINIIILFMLLLLPVKTISKSHKKNIKKVFSYKNELNISSKILFVNKKKFEFHIKIYLRGPFGEFLKKNLLKKTRKEEKKYISNLCNFFLRNNNTIISYNCKNLSYHNQKNKPIKLIINGKSEKLKWARSNHLIMKLPLLSSSFLKRIKHSFLVSENIIVGSKLKQEFNMNFHPPQKNIKSKDLKFNFNVKKLKHNFYQIKLNTEVLTKKAFMEKKKNILNNLKILRKEFLIFQYE